MTKNFRRNRRTNRRRFNLRRRVKRRDPQIVAKRTPLAGRVPNSMRLFRSDIEAMIPVHLTDPILGLNYYQICIPLNFPTMARNIGDTYGQINTTNFPGSALTSVWPRFVGTVGSDMFDEYRVMRLVVKFVPVGLQTQTTTSNWPARDDPGVLYSYNDLDDTALLTAPVEAKYMNNGAFPRSLKNGPVYLEFRQKPELRKYYFNSQNVSLSPSTVLAAINQTQLAGIPSPYASMKLLFPFDSELTTTQFIGRLYVRWECIFRGINSSAS